MNQGELPIPPHFRGDLVDQIFKVDYQGRAKEAEAWASEHGVAPACSDEFRISLLLVDVQNTFCIPGFELFVGGPSGTGAVDDNRRLCEFIYRNLGVITEMCPTMDTHQAAQIFHGLFLVGKNGEHPAPFTMITPQDVAQGVWRFNEKLSPSLNCSPEYSQEYLLHYTRKLQQTGKYMLTIWPYHAMLGGIGHALVPAVEEALFFYSVVRFSQPDFQLKGNNPFSENYSVLSPEVGTGPGGETVGEKNARLIQKLLDFDALVVAGQAKSHCVAWTIDDLLKEIRMVDEKLARKVYLLEDCCSPVVVPGVMDYAEEADRSFSRFEQAGMNVVRSTDPLVSWPGLGA